ncbi:hypothetical protein I3760_14G066900 [Carya illinoinensis]|nr:hypothetical protein I3760_14G066900 [Carya illinoinensis]
MICTNSYPSLPPPIPVLNTYSKSEGARFPWTVSLFSWLPPPAFVICLLLTEPFALSRSLLSLSLEYLSHCSLQKIKFLVSKLAMASIIEYGWLYLITHFSDFQLACLGSFFLHESVFFLSGIPFIYLERARWLSKYKIQSIRDIWQKRTLVKDSSAQLMHVPITCFHVGQCSFSAIELCYCSSYSMKTKNNSPAAQEKCITRLLLYHFGVNLPVMVISYPVFKYMGMQSSLPLPSWNVVLTQIIFYFILEDFVFYWGHRVLHTKWLYKHVHSVHHEYATPFGLTSEYAHPAEILFLGFATIIGPAITGPHLMTLWLWMVLRVLETVEAHCGYHFPWSLSNFLPWYGGADFHDYHHRLLYTKSGNYSSTFTYMDRVFGTDKGYRKLKALKNDGIEDGSKQK